MDKKKSGKGFRERNREQHQRRREERGEPACGQADNDPPVDDLTGKRPRRLDPSYVIDCKFAEKFGRKWPKNAKPSGGNDEDTQIYLTRPMHEDADKPITDFLGNPHF